MVLISGEDMLEDFRRATDEELSFPKALEDIFHTKNTLGDHVVYDDYQVEFVKSILTRTIDDSLPAIHEETLSSLAEYLPQTAGGSRLS